MRPLPERAPDVDRRWAVRVAPDPYLRFDTNDYSLDPKLVGRRVEVRATEREIAAVVPALEHARKLRERRGERDDDVVVEQRPLAVYDALIA